MLKTETQVQGTFTTICDTTYFFSKAEVAKSKACYAMEILNNRELQKNWTDAGSECCKMNMDFLSVETKAEQVCLSKSIYGMPEIPLYTLSSIKHLANAIFKCQTKI